MFFPTDSRAAPWVEFSVRSRIIGLAGFTLGDAYEASGLARQAPRSLGRRGPVSVSRDGLAEICGSFEIAGVLREVGSFGNGHIHDTFLARFEAGNQCHRFVLQRINARVFPEPVAVMHNVSRVIRHIRSQVEDSGSGDVSRRCLRLVPTRSGDSHLVTEDGAVWRVYHYVEDSRALREVADFREAHRAARAFGRFAAQLVDLPTAELREPLPHFHDLYARLSALRRAREDDRRGRAAACAPDCARLTALFQRLEPGLRALPTLPLRPVHNDCKLDNLLVDAKSGEPLCVIDLDTVMPGNLLADFGELTRTGATRAAEDERDLSRVDFDLERFRGLAAGYLEGLGESMSPEERAALPLAGPLLTLENAARFLSDHLSGDVYFRIQRPGQNLDRARCQLRLLERMLDAEREMRATLQTGR